VHGDRVAEHARIVVAQAQGVLVARAAEVGAVRPDERARYADPRAEHVLVAEVDAQPDWGRLAVAEPDAVQDERAALDDLDREHDLAALRSLVEAELDVGEIAEPEHTKARHLE